jgi:nicotinate-nucleotide pyrophosphorylase (carboxylating)
MLTNRAVTDLIRQALSEDLGNGDITSEATIPAESTSEAVILAKQHLVLAGIDVAREVFRQLDPAIRFSPFAKDGDIIHAGRELARLSGNTRSLLAGERVALNLLQHLSGIATLTAAYVEKIKGLQAEVLDTRKTLPGLRLLEKYAVRMGGRTTAGLYDVI